VDPPTGFYPDWLTEFCRRFNDLSGENGVKYNLQGQIECTRVYQPSSAGIFRDLFDGISYVSEPYYIVDGFYTGTGETCNVTNDCRPAKLASGRESCMDNSCAHDKSPRTRHFRASCSSIGVDSTFMTKKKQDQPILQTNDESDGPSMGLMVALLVLGFFVAFFGVLSCMLIRRELSGNPLFKSLKETSDTPCVAPKWMGNSAA
jgi:hypothetical protein